MHALFGSAPARSMGLLAAGVVLDWLFGDPHGIWHPVQGIGALIHLFEKIFRKMFPKTRSGELLAGGCMTAAVLASTAVIVSTFVKVSGLIHPLAGVLAELYLYYSALAARSLHVESRKVKLALEHGGLQAGREAVSMIVGRDTQNLSEEGVIRAAIETVAENTSDGIIAPMLYLAFSGPFGGWLYKAVNTMDSMTGYKNDTYLYFGRTAAKLDDVLNFVPARFSALCMIFASALPGMRMNPKQAWAVYKRDRYKHASPNSAHTEAVMAGALGVQLAGDASYFGKTVKKETIGNPDRRVEPEDISRAAILMYAAQAAGFLICMAVLLFWFLVTAQH